MKKLLFILLVPLLFINSSYAFKHNKELEKYVNRLLDQGDNILRDKSINRIERCENVRYMIRQYLYFDWMARYALGRYRKKMSNQQILDFVDVYSDFVTKAYSDLAEHYNGEKAKIKNIKSVSDGIYMVNTEIIKPDGQSISVDYLIHEIKNNRVPYKVGDIITEGISILNSQRSEFNSVISSMGINKLTKDLTSRSKTSCK